ncbi:MAG: hypothetical protein ABSG86_01750 [Thermoguttaceae bacterium]|jgi:hypothetical protein
MPARLDARVFALPKDPDQPSGYQDASAVDPQRGIAAIADGVSSSLFSGRWASILTEAAVGDAPDPGEQGLFAAWLATQRKLWATGIDTASLAWFQRAKLPMGAFSTLLWVRVLELPEAADPGDHAAHGAPAAPGSFGAYRLLAHAIGDSCLFQVRRGELVRSFPLQTSAELEADPLVLGSVDLRRDQLLQFAALNEICYPDDLLILCTDALAQWALRGYESGNPPDWLRAWDMPPDAWRAEIAALREHRQLQDDDTTLVMLRIAEAPLEAILAPENPTAAAEPAAAPLDWIRSASKGIVPVSARVADQIDQTSGRVLRGLKSLKDKALKKYRDKFGKKDPPEPP